MKSFKTSEVLNWWLKSQPVSKMIPTAEHLAFASTVLEIVEREAYTSITAANILTEAKQVFESVND